MKPKPIWAMMILVLANAAGTFRDVARPGVLVTVGCGVIAFEWARENDQL